MSVTHDGVLPASPEGQFIARYPFHCSSGEATMRMTGQEDSDWALDEMNSMKLGD